MKLRSAILPVSALALLAVRPARCWDESRAETAPWLDTERRHSLRTQGAELVLSAEPDVMISRGRMRPQVEFDITARPGSAQRMIAGGMGLDHPDGGTTCNVFRSRDGGKSWERAVIPILDEAGGADPVVGYTPAGTAMFVCLAFTRDESGRRRVPVMVFRSEDDGATWTKAFSSSTSEDAPVLGFDRTGGQYAGRAYVATLSGGDDYFVRVFRSADDGRTWVGPSIALRSSTGRGVQAEAVGVFSDGTLFLPYVDFPLGPSRDSSNAQAVLGSVTSMDGAVTFGEPVRGPTLRGRLDREDSLARLAGTRAQVLVDHSARHQDRVYAVWTRYAAGRLRIVISVSRDRGRSWTEAREVDPGVGVNAHQFNPHLAVSPLGVLGVAWLDTRATTDASGYHEYFAASADGGETFSAPLRVSTALSVPVGRGNLAPSPATFAGTRGERRMALLPALSRFPQGGDYLGMTADARGRFHPVWPDARGGTFQAYTAAVSVDTARAGASMRAGMPADVTRQMAFLVDASEADVATGEVRLLVRLRNTGTRTVYGPLKVAVRGFGSGMGTDFQRFSPEILNSDNGETGIGAEFDFTEALGSTDVLSPGAVTGARLWRIQLRDVRRLPDLHLYITAVLEGT